MAILELIIGITIRIVDPRRVNDCQLGENKDDQISTLRCNVLIIPPAVEQLVGQLVGQLAEQLSNLLLELSDLLDELQAEHPLELQAGLLLELHAELP
jgi:hypothetical protein